MNKKREKSSIQKTNRKTKKLSSELEETLVKNLIELQKVHTDLAEKFNSLTKEISQLLALFEVTAKNFSKNIPIGEYEKDKEFLEKIDKLLDQNKTLAKGLMLMEERLRDRMYGHSNLEEKPEAMRRPISQPDRPLPRF
ncbi:hypothetical protein HY450_01005 [Candidatus Pacearchaeota archaeon]|nr:hypothetical protein [Candidatus Pacearchaeota archaeon]